jgi:hypothetical protein
MAHISVVNGSGGDEMLQCRRAKSVLNFVNEGETARDTVTRVHNSSRCCRNGGVGCGIVDVKAVNSDVPVPSVTKNTRGRGRQI